MAFYIVFIALDWVEEDLQENSNEPVAWRPFILISNVLICLYTKLIIIVLSKVL